MLVPKLRFKREDGTEYPEWEELTMSEIFTEIIEKNRPDLPVLSILQGQGTVYRDSSDRNIQYDKKSTSNYKAMKKGDFIIHLRTFEGGLECATLDGISSPAYKILRTDKLVPEAYRAYFRSRQFIDGKLAIAVTGVRDGKNIEMSTFWQILVPVPCLEEQQKIADFLSTVDEVIAQSKAEVQNLERQKKAAMQKIFSQEVRFKREDGIEYPEWEEKALSDICEPHARIGWQNLRTDEFLDEGDYYLVTGTDFLNGRVNFATCHFIDRERFEQDKNIQIKNGDILITKDGTLGKIALVENMDKEGTLNAGVFVLQKLDNNIYNLYLYQYLTAPYLLNFASDKATGGTIKHLNQGILVQFPVPIPCLEEQQKIADFLSAYDEAIRCAKQELDKWKELKKGLLQQMFV